MLRERSAKNVCRTTRTHTCTRGTPCKPAATRTAGIYYSYGETGTMTIQDSAGTASGWVRVTRARRGKSIVSHSDASGKMCAEQYKTCAAACTGRDRRRRRRCHFPRDGNHGDDGPKVERPRQQSLERHYTLYVHHIRT